MYDIVTYNSFYATNNTVRKTIKLFLAQVVFMLSDSVELDSFLHDIALVHYSDELLEVFQNPLQQSLSGASIYVINKTTYNHVVCCTLPIITKAKASPHAIQALLTSTAQKSHELMQAINTIAQKLRITVQELLEPLPGSNPEVLTTKPAIIIGSIKAFLAQKRVQPELIQDIETITIDAIDAMINLGYGEDLKTLLKFQTIAQWLVFSTTEQQKIDAVLSAASKNIQKITLEDTAITPDVLKQQLYHVNKQEKIPLLLGILQALPKAVVVCNTKGAAEYVTNRLRANTVSASLFLSYISRKEQKEILEGFQKGTTSVLVTNDKSLERSGIKIQYLINYDLPLSPQAYKLRLHHIDTSGTHTAISFACEEYVYNLPIIEQELGFKIPVEELVPSKLKADKDAVSHEYKRSRSRDKNNYQRNGKNDDYSHNAQKHNESKHPTRNQHIEKQKKYNHDRNHAEHYTTGHNENSNAALYAMSAEERLKYYQEKYGKKFNTGKTEGSYTKKGKQRTSGKPTNTKETTRIDKQPHRHSTDRNQTNNNRKSGNAKKQIATNRNNPQKSSVFRNLLTGISNLFKVKTKKDKQD